jgi:membrane-associated phospholipid phosphatase
MNLLIGRLLLLITFLMGPIFIRQYYLSVGYICGIIVTVLLNVFLKWVFLLPRPSADLEQFKTSLKLHKNDPSFIMVHCGMPSGHAQLAGFALTYIILATHSWWIWSFVTLFTIGVCIQRVMTNAHTVLQVLVGLCVGMAIGVATYNVMVRFLKL